MKKEQGKNRKIKKNFKYSGLGFPVILEEVIVETIEGEDYYHIDFQELKYSFLILIMFNPNLDLIGGMLKFTRQSLELSMDEMAERMQVAKSTIAKWESKVEEKIKLSDLQLFRIKQDIKSHLDKIMEYKIERVLDKKKKDAPASKKAAPLKVPTQISLASLFDNNFTFA